MNRHTFLSLAAAVALWSTPATSALINVENAYEIEAGDILMPDGDTGQAILHPCPTCKTVLLKVNSDTTYRANSDPAPTSLGKFRPLLKKFGHKLLVVTYRLDNGVVTHMVLAN